MSKKIVTVEVYDQEGSHHYEGRCVGLINGEEFSALIKSTELQRKLTTVKTVPLLDVANVKRVEDLRLVVVTRKETLDKKLFITEPIELISQFTAPDDVTLVGTDGAYITIKET